MDIIVQMSSNWKHYLHFIVCKSCPILEYKLPEIQLRVRDAQRLKGRRWKKVFHANRNDKKTGVAICIFDNKTEFKTEAKKRKKEGIIYMQRPKLKEPHPFGARQSL